MTRFDGNRPMLRSISLKNLLSFGPDAVTLQLGSLNVLIGPNASGKSNLIEALALVRSTPVPTSASASDLGAVLRRGGGPRAWVWKGIVDCSATVETLVHNPKSKQPLRHVLSFTGNDAELRIEDERIENEAPSKPEREPYFYYRFQNGRPVVNTKALAKQRKLARETLEPNLSILAQRRDPEQYPEIAHLAGCYERIRIYREWAFGRNTIYRVPQRADMRNDRLEEDFSNLGVFLSRLRKSPKTKATIVEHLKDLYAGVSDFDLIVEGGSVQVFFSEGDFSVPATRLSDGTLRFLALLAILCDPAPPPLICIEEPELGLHPDIMPKLADLLVEASQRAQLIVTTHSDVLVDALTERPESIVVCEKHGGATQLQRLKSSDLSEWLGEYRLGQMWTKGLLGGTRW